MQAYVACKGGSPHNKSHVQCLSVVVLHMNSPCPRHRSLRLTARTCFSSSSFAFSLLLLLLLLLSYHQPHKPPAEASSLLLVLRQRRLVGKVLTCRPRRCADVPAYDSMLDSPIRGLSFRSIPMVVCALALKRWIVQNGASETTGGKVPFWTIHRFNIRARTYVHGWGYGEMKARV